MELHDPLVFEPLFMERVWGGRRLDELFGKKLPPGARIGEAWEIVDREEAQSVVHAGPLRGETLHELWTGRREAIFGTDTPASDRFPLLLKLLDAEDRLSLQVHPPPAIAGQFGGEPKTEMWYFAHTEPGADIFAGLKPGVTREIFEEALANGSVANEVHRIEAHVGGAIFIPSGRLHAIGAGNVIVEVQQNSDTTYRVFDWNRTGLDGRPRALHFRESLESIDFSDVEPALATPREETLVECEHFRVERLALSGAREAAPQGVFAIFCCLEGNVGCGATEFSPGRFFLVPAGMRDRLLHPVSGEATVLRATIPRN